VAPSSRSRVRIWPHLVWAGFIVSVVAALLVAVAQSATPHAECGGYGLGCMSGPALAAFTAMYVVPIALVVMAIGHVLIAFVQSLRRRR
jgi:hypothetical protein